MKMAQNLLVLPRPLTNPNRNSGEL